MLYSGSKNPASSFPINKCELMKYIGICLITSVVQMSNVRMYWHSVVGVDLVKNCMSQKQFEKIRSVIHFNDNSMNSNDKLHKLRPVIDILSANFAAVPKEEMLSVDEQMCSTKARHHLKQYMPLKPNK